MRRERQRESIRRDNSIERIGEGLQRSPFDGGLFGEGSDMLRHYRNINNIRRDHTMMSSLGMREGRADEQRRITQSRINQLQSDIANIERPAAGEFSHSNRVILQPNRHAPLGGRISRMGLPEIPPISDDDQLSPIEYQEPINPPLD